LLYYEGCSVNKLQNSVNFYLSKYKISVAISVVKDGLQSQMSLSEHNCCVVHATVLECWWYTKAGVIW